MIKFFRHIRRSLIQKNKMGKYFKYAIGEILLVVIGILIALQINNWNENRKAQNFKTQYCEQLLQEIELDVENINVQLERLEGDIKSYNTYEAIYETPNISLDTIYTNIKKLSPYYGIATFNTKTIEVLKSTGDIKLFSNKFQTLLVTLESAQKYYFDAHKINYDLYTSMIDETYLLNNISIEQKLANQDDFAKALKFKEKLPDQLALMHMSFASKNFADIGSLSMLKNTLKKTEELKLLVEKEIKE